MSASKGDRVAFLVRLPRDALSRLDAYALEVGLDGRSSALEELVALRGDRDAELVEARRLVAEARLLREADLGELARLRRELRRERRLLSRLRGGRVGVSLGVFCGCGVRLSEFDVGVGLVDCEGCRRDRVAALTKL